MGYMYMYGLCTKLHVYVLYNITNANTIHVIYNIVHKSGKLTLISLTNKPFDHSWNLHIHVLAPLVYEVYTTQNAPHHITMPTL